MVATKNLLIKHYKSSHFHNCHLDYLISFNWKTNDGDRATSRGDIAGPLRICVTCRERNTKWHKPLCTPNPCLSHFQQIIFRGSCAHPGFEPPFRCVITPPVPACRDHVMTWARETGDATGETWSGRGRQAGWGGKRRRKTVGRYSCAVYTGISFTCQDAVASLPSALDWHMGLGVKRS